MNELARFARFAISGAASTAAAYLVFIAALRLGFNYSLAVTASWPPAMLTGFILNRRFTFGIRRVRGRIRELGLFIVGSLLQLVLAIIGLDVLMKLGLTPTAAFALNLSLTSSCSFAFHRLITFRRRSRPAAGLVATYSPLSKPTRR